MNFYNFWEWKYSYFLTRYMKSKSILKKKENELGIVKALRLKVRLTINKLFHWFLLRSLRNSLKYRQFFVIVRSVILFIVHIIKYDCTYYKIGSFVLNFNFKCGQWPSESMIPGLPELEASRSARNNATTRKIESRLLGDSVRMLSHNYWNCHEPRRERVL